MRSPKANEHILPNKFWEDELESWTTASSISSSLPVQHILQAPVSCQPLEYYLYTRVLCMLACSRAIIKVMSYIYIYNQLLDLARG